MINRASAARLIGGSDVRQSFCCTPGRERRPTVSPAGGSRLAAAPERFAIRSTVLRDGDGNGLAELWAVRSFADVEGCIQALRRKMTLAWLIAMAA